MGPARGDTAATFVADINDSFFRSARGAIKIEGGLLQSSEVVTRGEVGEIVISTATSLASLLTAGGRGPTGGRPPSGSAQLTCSNSEIIFQRVDVSEGSRTVNLTFNPSDPRDVRNVNFSLCRAGFLHRVFVTPPADPATRPVAEAEGGETGDGVAIADMTVEQRQQVSDVRANVLAASGISLDSLGGTAVRSPDASTICPDSVCPGLIYRQPQPWGVHIVRLDPACNPGAGCAASTYPYVERSWRFDLPNAAPLHALPYNTSWFVSRRDTLAFVDGSLVSHDFDHPSEVAAATAIPRRVVTSAFGAVSQVLQLRFNLTRGEQNLANARRDYLTSLNDPGANEVTRLRNIEDILKLELSIANLRRQIDDLEASAPE